MADKIHKLQGRAREALGTEFVRPVGRPQSDHFPAGWEEYEQVWEVCPHDDVATIENAGVRYRSCKSCPWTDQSG